MLPIESEGTMALNNIPPTHSDSLHLINRHFKQISRRMYKKPIWMSHTRREHASGHPCKGIPGAHKQRWTFRVTHPKRPTTAVASPQPVVNWLPDTPLCNAFTQHSTIQLGDKSEGFVGALVRDRRGCPQQMWYRETRTTWLWAHSHSRWGWPHAH